MKKATITVIFLTFLSYGLSFSTAQAGNDPGWRIFKNDFCYTMKIPSSWKIMDPEEDDRPEHSGNVVLYSTSRGLKPGEKRMDCTIGREDVRSIQDSLKSHVQGNVKLREGSLSIGGEPASEIVYNESGSIYRYIVLLHQDKGYVFQCREGSSGRNDDKDIKSDKDWKYGPILDKILSSFKFRPGCKVPEGNAGNAFRD